MPRKSNPNRQLRGKLNLTIHPEIRDFAEKLSSKRRRSLSQLFEDLVEAEWNKQHSHPSPPSPPAYPLPGSPSSQYYPPPPPYSAM
jgi:hypothetical protein